jgi:hypothetical protein
VASRTTGADSIQVDRGPCVASIPLVLAFRWEESVNYRYEGFNRELINEDARFTDRGALGTMLPDFDMLDVDGASVRRSDYIGRRPLLLTFGSIT